MEIDHPEYRLISARLRSFADWPRNKTQNPRNLSTAGFFYTGSSDRVICFSCGGGLRDWDEGDVPWEQHALWLYNCKFLKSMKGEDYIKSVRDSYFNQDQSVQFDDKDEDKLCKVCYVRKYEIVLIPCGHIVVCKNCVLLIKKCPLCRGGISDTIKVYFS